MKIHKTLSLAVALMAGLFATTASAVPILVSYTAQVPLQPSNNGDATFLTWAQNSVAAYNVAFSASLPSVSAQTIKLSQGDANPYGQVFGSSTTSITLNVTGMSYLALSWGGSSLPAGNGNADILYYINGTTGNVTFSNTGFATGGLSSVHVYDFRTPPPNTTGVPDGGSAVLMFGLSLAGLAFARSRRIA